MSIMDDIDAEAKRRGGKCSVGLWLRAMDDGMQAEWAAAFASTAAHAAIHRVMIARGWDGCRSSVDRHRTGGCRCSR